eukprot:12674205-Heterocapsa_arctica.AAC.1
MVPAVLDEPCGRSAGPFAGGFHIRFRGRAAPYAPPATDNGGAPTHAALLQAPPVAPLVVHPSALLPVREGAQLHPGRAAS